jgi:hypothetical protein
MLQYHGKPGQPHFINMAEYLVGFPRSEYDEHARVILGRAAKIGYKMSRVIGIEPVVEGHSFLVYPDRRWLNPIVERSLMSKATYQRLLQVVSRLFHQYPVPGIVKNTCRDMECLLKTRHNHDLFRVAFHRCA